MEGIRHQFINNLSKSLGTSNSPPVPTVATADGGSVMNLDVLFNIAPALAQSIRYESPLLLDDYEGFWLVEI